MLNEFFTIDDLWRWTIEQLLFHADHANSRIGDTRELVGYQARLSNIDATFLMNERRRLSPHYGCAEFLWYLSADAHIGMISAYAPQYAKFAENGIAFGAYGARMYSNVTNSNCSQLELLVKHLKSDQHSRQAIITLWQADDLMHAILKDHKDLPCTISLQFLIRSDKLHMITTMRSNDAWLGLPYDIFAFTCIQRIVAMAVGVPCGSYTHQAGSEHLYEKHWKAAEEALYCKEPVAARKRMTHEWPEVPQGDWLEDIRAALLTEGLARNGKLVQHLMPVCTTAVRDAALCCANKWLPTIKPISPILCKGIELCLSSKEPTA